MGRALVLHRTARAHLHQAVGAILQTLGYTVTQNRDGSLRIDGPAGATEGAQTSAELATSAGAGLDDLETLRARGDRGPRGGSDEDGDDGSAGVLARL
ncbi:hypothetical protein ACFZB9_26810 [Kitasatospora sp. NPDC008050]|uniref:hypothetical protein n=1 Tax=Kitasatospora sp. NPDC008050 TaxID=3364021 RepID=UPI0036EE703B